MMERDRLKFGVPGERRPRIDGGMDRPGRLFEVEVARHRCGFGICIEGAFAAMRGRNAN